MLPIRSLGKFRLLSEETPVATSWLSWAERHVRWMIQHNVDGHGNPWPDGAEP
jgi:hypothetical protein